jgi:hypothetical protein
MRGVNLKERRLLWLSTGHNAALWKASLQFAAQTAEAPAPRS